IPTPATERRRDCRGTCRRLAMTAGLFLAVSDAGGEPVKNRASPVGKPTSVTETPHDGADRLRYGKEMSDERSDLILNMLRGIRAEQAAQREKLDEIISRLGRLEREVADLHREVAGLHDDYAGLSVRLDNLDRRVGRIESRLELVDQPS